MSLSIPQFDRFLGALEKAAHVPRSFAQKGFCSSDGTVADAFAGTYREHFVLTFPSAGVTRLDLQALLDGPGRIRTCARRIMSPLLYR
jgi:hypothetical protein